MDNLLPLFLKSPGDTSLQGKQGSQSNASLDALSATFADLLQRAGYNLENGLDLFAKHGGFDFAGRRAETPEPAKDVRPDDPRPRERDDAETRPENDEPRRDVSRADRRDDHADERARAPRDERPRGERDDGDVQASHRPEDRPQEQTGDSADAAARDKGAAEGNAARNDSPDTNSDQNAHPDGAKNGAGAAAQTANASDGPAVPTPAGLQHAEAILAELLAAAQANLAPGQGVQNSAASGEAQANATNALQGLAKAIAALGNHGGQQQNNPNGTQNLPPEIQALAKAIVEARTGTKPANEAGANANASSTVQQQQAQGLAQAIGDGNRAQITVKVTSEGETLVSQQTSNLSASAATVNDGQTLSLRAQQAAQNPAAVAPHQNTQQAVVNNNQAQQAAAQSSQSQSTNMMSADAKPATSAAPVAPAAANHGPTSGGGEGSTSSGSHGGSHETQQSQQSQHTQQAQGPRFHVPRQAVLDQITVNISRAVQTGMDKINIQLKPESLGRVDVQLEVAKDGKVTAVVHADNKDTLDLLQRDAKELARALQGAGLNMDEGDIAFNLRGRQGGDGEDSGNGSSAGDGTGEGGNETAADDGDGETDIVEDGRVNIRV